MRLGRQAAGAAPAGAWVRPGSSRDHTACARAAPARRLARLARAKSGERGHQHGANGVHQPPARPEPSPPGASWLCVHTDLDWTRCCTSSPGPTAPAVEEFLHGRVTGQVEHAWGGRTGSRPWPESRRPAAGTCNVARLRAPAAATASRKTGGGGAELEPPAHPPVLVLSSRRPGGLPGVSPS